MAKPRSAESRTEHLLKDLLAAKGFITKKPPTGDFLIKQEYKDYDVLKGLFKSKHGKDDGLPEGIIVEKETLTPLAVIEAKGNASQIDIALAEAEFYAEGCLPDYEPVAIGIAGHEDEFVVKVSYWRAGKWNLVTYDNNPITWIPNLEDIKNISASKIAGAEIDLRPSVPSQAVLATKADEINKLLRESDLRDEYRSSAVAAMMLALWQTKGKIRREPDYILTDINNACSAAFKKAGKPILSESLKVNEANHKLAIKSRRICSILESLNVTVLTAEHDYIGQLYEAFFRYTGGNTIGQYFTPRHIAELSADITEVTLSDIVLDPACGTGGFLIAAMERTIREQKITREEVVKVVADKLLGYENEPVTAALCVANMILRGDGTTGIKSEDSLQASSYPTGQVSVVLMNPPFPHKKTDTPSERFVDRGLEALKTRGLLAAIVSSSLLVKADKKQWRDKTLANNTLKAVISLPTELFQPYASATTALIVLEKGIKNSGATFFARLTNDGFRLKKGVRQRISGSEIPSVLSNYREHKAQSGFSGLSKVSGESGWATGAYISIDIPTTLELKPELATAIRSKSAFVVQYAYELSKMQSMIDSGELMPKPYETMLSKQRKKTSTVAAKGTVGELFNIYYGQKSLHSKDGLVSGESLVISSSGTDNGCYGFFDFQDLIKPPFVTVPSTGSIGEAHVQEYACGVTDDCLILTPKDGVQLDKLYIAAAILRRERWRFDYGRKITPERIRNFPMTIDDEVISFVQENLKKAENVESLALKSFSEL